MKAMRNGPLAALMTIAIVTGCSSQSTASRPSTSPTSTAAASPTPAGTVAPNSVPLSTGRCADPRPSPPFAVPPPSNRLLALVAYKGSQYFVRDVTNVNHAFNVAWFDAANRSGLPGQGPKFAGPSAISYVDGIYLERLPFHGTPSGIAAPCAGLIWGAHSWSADGRVAAYVTEVPSHQVQLRLVTAGMDRPLAVVRASISDDNRILCDSAGTDPCDLDLLFSPDGKYISYVQRLYGPDLLRIWSAAGELLLWRDSTGAGMSVWLGDTFYFEDQRGVEAWTPQNGVSLLSPGLKWIRPKGSPDGNYIVFGTRDDSGTSHVMLLDARTMVIRELGKERSAPAFLSDRYIWYQEERPCSNCSPVPATPDGKAYVYDLSDGSETSSPIGAVFDVWLHPA